LVVLYEQLEKTTKRLEKTKQLADFLQQLPEKDFSHVLLLLEGRVFPAWDERKIGMASRLLLKVISMATGASQEKLEEEWKKTGNLGDVAASVKQTKRQATLFAQELTTQKVFENLQKLATIEGHGTVDLKVKLVVELLTSASSQEAKYIVRTILEDLRVGLGEGTVRDAIVWAFFADKIGLTYDAAKNELVLPDDNRTTYEEYLNAVQEAYNVANDFAAVALAAKQGLHALQNIYLLPGKPVKVMLYQKAEDILDAFEIVGKPAAFEYKFDGFRLQIHKADGKLVLFTRRLENVTTQFPDVLAAVEQNVVGDSFVLDAEAVGYSPETKKYIAFQNISQRIKRKYDIAEMAVKFPVELDLFDVLYYNGQSQIKKTFAERRVLLQQILARQIPQKIQLAQQIVTAKEDVAARFYEQSLAAGNEGMMVKNLQGMYKPGSRVGYGVKIKPTLDTLEVVIVGAEWGEGKRSKWLSSYVIAVRNPETGELLEIGRVSTGLKEKPEEGMSFQQISELLQPLIITEKGREVVVKPEVVIEVDYEEIQKSPSYTSGFALRFPRFVKLREDRGKDDVSTTEEVKRFYEKQRGRAS